jgi:hypothetical protein
LNKPLKNEILEFFLPFRRIISDRNIDLRFKILEEFKGEERFCSNWRVYKSILYHIVSNAVKFSNPGGKIGIEITYQENNEDCIEESSGSNSFEVDDREMQKQVKNLKVGTLKTCVMDDGVGMNRK